MVIPRENQEILFVISMQFYKENCFTDEFKLKPRLDKVSSEIVLKENKLNN